MKYFEACKIWNAQQKSAGNQWCIPKKGSKEYDEVIAIMKGTAPKPVEVPVKKEEPKKAEADVEKKPEDMTLEELVKSGYKSPLELVSTDDLQNIVKVYDEFEKLRIELSDNEFLATMDIPSFISIIKKTDKYDTTKDSATIENIKNYGIEFIPVARSNRYVRIKDTDEAVKQLENAVTILTKEGKRIKEKYTEIRNIWESVQKKYNVTNHKIGNIKDIINTRAKKGSTMMKAKVAAEQKKELTNEIVQPKKQEPKNEIIAPKKEEPTTQAAIKKKFDDGRELIIDTLSKYLKSKNKPEWYEHYYMIVNKNLSEGNPYYRFHPKRLPKTQIDDMLKILSNLDTPYPIKYPMDGKDINVKDIVPTEEKEESAKLEEPVKLTAAEKKTINEEKKKIHFAMVKYLSTFMNHTFTWGSYSFGHAYKLILATREGHSMARTGYSVQPYFRMELLDKITNKENSKEIIDEIIKRIEDLKLSSTVKIYNGTYAPSKTPIKIISKK